jgi:hypothetical protein
VFTITDQVLDRDNRFPIWWCHFHNIRMTPGIDLPACRTLSTGIEFLILVLFTMQATGKLPGKTPLPTPPGSNKKKRGWQFPGPQPPSKSFHDRVVSFDTLPAHPTDPLPLYLFRGRLQLLLDNLLHP